MNYHSSMTSKGQVTVPKDIRDALGLEPGFDVEFEINAEGDAIIRKAHDEERLKAREADIIRRVMEVREQFRAQDQMPGISSDDYYELMRGPPAEV